MSSVNNSKPTTTMLSWGETQKYAGMVPSGVQLNSIKKALGDSIISLQGKNVTDDTTLNDAKKKMNLSDRQVQDIQSESYKKSLIKGILGGGAVTTLGVALVMLGIACLVSMIVLLAMPPESAYHTIRHGHHVVKFMKSAFTLPVIFGGIFGFFGGLAGGGFTIFGGVALGFGLSNKQDFTKFMQKLRERKDQLDTLLYQLKEQSTIDRKQLGSILPHLTKDELDNVSKELDLLDLQKLNDLNLVQEKIKEELKESARFVKEINVDTEKKMQNQQFIHEHLKKDKQLFIALIQEISAENLKKCDAILKEAAKDLFSIEGQDYSKFVSYLRNEFQIEPDKIEVKVHIAEYYFGTFQIDKHTQHPFWKKIMQRHLEDLDFVQDVLKQNPEAQIKNNLELDLRKLSDVRLSWNQLDAFIKMAKTGEADPDLSSEKVEQYWTLADAWDISEVKDALYPRYKAILMTYDFIESCEYPRSKLTKCKYTNKLENQIISQIHASLDKMSLNDLLSLSTQQLSQFDEESRKLVFEEIKKRVKALSLSQIMDIANEKYEVLHPEIQAAIKDELVEKMGGMTLLSVIPLFQGEKGEKIFGYVKESLRLKIENSLDQKYVGTLIFYLTDTESIEFFKRFDYDFKFASKILEKFNKMDPKIFADTIKAHFNETIKPLIKESFQNMEENDWNSFTKQYPMGEFPPELWSLKVS